MRVNLSAPGLSPLLPTPEPVTKGAPGRGTSFAALHSASLAKLSSVATPSSGTAGAATDGTRETSARASDGKSAKPKNETYQAVDGQPYEEIVSGPRNGMFINRSGNQRDGEAFVLVERNGRRFHIYGSGADRQVVPIANEDKPSGSKPATGGEQRAKGVEYRDVEGRAYDEIMSGPRNGMFINRSGNARDGKAFVLVKRDDHELHIYGSGANRLVVRVVPPELRKGDDAAPAVSKTETAERPSTTPVGGTPRSGSAVLPA